MPAIHNAPNPLLCAAYNNVMVAAAAACTLALCSGLYCASYRTNITCGLPIASMLGHDVARRVLKNSRSRTTNFHNCLLQLDGACLAMSNSSTRISGGTGSGL